MIYLTDKDRKPLRPMTPEELVLATVAELRNALTPAIVLARANGKPEVVLELLSRGVERAATWADNLAEHMHEREAESVEARFKRMEQLGLVRLAVEHDELHTFEMFEGDMYNAEANPDIDPAQLEAERSVAREQFENEGAFGLCSFISRRGSWEYVDGVWGMHPRSYADDPKNEYREQLMQAALAKLDGMLAGAT